METTCPTVVCDGRTVTLEHAAPIPEPKLCPSCGGPVQKRKGLDGSVGVMHFCPSDHCPAKNAGKIRTWIKKLDIQGLGDVYIEALLKHKVVRSISCLYRLRKRGFTDLCDENGRTILGAKQVTKILDEIDRKRELTLPLFLGSLGIEGLGRRRVAIVQEKDPGQFDTLNDWLSGKLVERAEQVGLPRSAKRIQEQIIANLNLIAELQHFGVTVTAAAPAPAKKVGSMVFCITGKLSQPKEHFHTLMTDKGHQFTDTYSKSVSCLVAADPASGSAKLKRATKDGVRIISEQELLDILG